MRRYPWVIWGALAFLCGPSLAWADEPAAEAAANPPAGNAPAADTSQDDATFTNLDKNQDGQLEETEVTDDQRGLFDRLMRRGDTNQDGKLSREEFLAGLKRRRERQGQGGPDGAPPGDPGARLEGMFRQWDANADGQVALDEVPEERQPMFERMLDQFDENDDDKLSLEEFRAGARRFAERFRGGAGGPPGGRPFGGRGGPPGGGPFGEGGGPPGGGRGRGGPGPLMAALDTDHDGQVSATEISAAPEALKKLDKNGDGAITQEELGPPPGGPPDGPPPGAQAGANIPPAPGPGQPGHRLMQGFHNADANSDGKLSREEMPPRIATHFDKMDVNSDGFVDEEEFRLALGYLAKRMNAGGGGRPGKGGKRPGAKPPSAL